MQLNMIHLHMEADKSLNMAGAAKCKMILFGKQVSIDVQGSFSPEKMVQKHH